MTKRALYAVAGSALPWPARRWRWRFSASLRATGRARGAGTASAAACVASRSRSTPAAALPPQLDGLARSSSRFLRVPKRPRARPLVPSSSAADSRPVVSGLPSTTLPSGRDLARPTSCSIDLTAAPATTRAGRLRPEDAEHRGACRGQGRRADRDPGVANHRHGPSRRRISRRIWISCRGSMVRPQTAPHPRCGERMRQHQHLSKKPWRRRPHQAYSGGCGGCRQTTPWRRR